MKMIKNLIDKEMADSWQASIKKDFDAGLKPKLISGRVYPDFFSMHPDASVLNIGVGLGPQAVTYKGRYNRMVGVDINIEKLLFAEAAAVHYDLPLHTCCCDVECLPFPEKQFDAAIAIDIIEHVRRPDKLLSETYRVLKDNGQLLITFPCLLDDWKKILRLIERVWRDFKTHAISVLNPVVFCRSVKNRIEKYSHTPNRIPTQTGRKPSYEHFNPDTHKHNLRYGEWINIVETSDFNIIRSRSTTLFPPLHVLGVTKFWFTNDFIYRIDSRLSSQKLLKRFGQSILCLAGKKTH